MNPPIDNSYIGITTPHFREAADFYVRHFGYSRMADTEGFASVMSPNKKRCLGFSAPDDACSSTPLSGIHLVFLVENATAVLAEFQCRGVPIARGLAVGSWGATHFVVTDPTDHSVSGPSPCHGRCVDLRSAARLPADHIPETLLSRVPGKRTCASGA